MPGVLLDRCRVLHFPEPGPEQVSMLAPCILERLYVDAGHDRRWATPLEAFKSSRRCLRPGAAGRDRMVAESYSPKIYNIKNLTILAVAEVVQLCAAETEMLARGVA